MLTLYKSYKNISFATLGWQRSSYRGRANVTVLDRNHVIIAPTGLSTLLCIRAILVVASWGVYMDKAINGCYVVHVTSNLS